MSDSNDSWSIKDILGGVIGGAILASLGVSMILNPDGTQTASGRRRLLQDLINWVWSTPGGIIFALLGLLIVAATIRQAINQRKSN
jgi:drug/metabolite transporter (DMT)-like permease|tara:strand:+ start:186 stop:443 length:258 start_codon:yes stop_codon:yes gene_type:complete